MIRNFGDLLNFKRNDLNAFLGFMIQLLAEVTKNKDGTAFSFVVSIACFLCPRVFGFTLTKEQTKSCLETLSEIGAKIKAGMVAIFETLSPYVEEFFEKCSEFANSISNYLGTTLGATLGAPLHTLV